MDVYLSQVSKIVVTHRFTTDAYKSHNGGDYSYGIMYIPDCVEQLNIARWEKTHWCDSDFYCCPICGQLNSNCSCDEGNTIKLSTSELVKELEIAFEKHSVKMFYTACKIVKSLTKYDLSLN